MEGGGTIFRFCGGDSCCKGGHIAHGGVLPTKENPDWVHIKSLMRYLKCYVYASSFFLTYFNNAMNY